LLPDEQRGSLAKGASHDNNSEEGKRWEGQNEEEEED
jgi:hypothetical protein